MPSLCRLKMPRRRRQRRAVCGLSRCLLGVVVPYMIHPQHVAATKNYSIQKTLDLNMLVVHPLLTHRANHFPVSNNLPTKQISQCFGQQHFKIIFKPIRCGWRMVQNIFKRMVQNMWQGHHIIAIATSW